MDTEKLMGQWVRDLTGLVAYLEEQLDHHLELEINDPATKAFVKSAHDTVRDHKKRTEHFTALHPHGSDHPVVETVFETLAKGVGLIDKRRDKNVTRALQELFSVMSHTFLAYEMFFVTSRAIGDTEAADYARDSMTLYGDLLDQLKRVVPTSILQDLVDQGADVRNRDEIISEANAIIDGN